MSLTAAEYVYGTVPTGGRGTVTYADGTRAWFRDGRLHRLDGPALIDPQGIGRYWVGGHRIYLDELRAAGVLVCVNPPYFERAQDEMILMSWLSDRRTEIEKEMAEEAAKQSQVQAQAQVQVQVQVQMMSLQAQQAYDAGQWLGQGLTSWDAMYGK